MYHQSILLVIMAISSQVISVDQHSHDPHSLDCLGPFLARKVQDFDYQLSLDLKTFRHKHTGSNFYAHIETELSDLAVTEQFKEIRLKSYESHLKETHPRFDLDFEYRGMIMFVGTHNTNGVLLAKKPFSGQGLVNISFDFLAHFETHMLNLKPTPSGYLKADEIQTRLKPDLTMGFFIPFYFENVSNNEVFSEHGRYFYDVMDGVLDNLSNKVYSQIETLTDGFWQQQIPQVSLSDVCITI